ncbi:MAG: arylsulfatase A [Saprospiraceae bacterium]|jgi:arylsulfatase A
MWINRKMLPPDVSANLPLQGVIIAETLKEAVYVNAHLDKWHVGDGAHFLELQGFHIYVRATIWGYPNFFFLPLSL